MKWNGIELEKITKTQIYDPPKTMLVWNNLTDYITESLVVAIVKRMDGLCAICFDGEIYPYCAEIPEAPKPRRATNRELAKWLAQGNGEICDTSYNKVHAKIHFDYEVDSIECDSRYRIRKWNDTDWHEPDVAYMGIAEVKHAIDKFDPEYGG